MKNSLSVFEMILTLLISSIIIIYSTYFLKELTFENKNSQQTQIDKIDFLSTKIFIEKHKSEIEKFSYSNKNLYFDGSLLLSDVEKFVLIKELEKITIEINLKNSIIQTWIFSL